MMDIKQECVYALVVNGNIVHHFVCTADHLEELTIGYLISKGCLAFEDIQQITIVEDELLIQVEASHYFEGWNQRNEILKFKNQPCKPCSEIVLDEALIRDKMHSYHSKGSHTAICITPEGMVIDRDVSRHCAIDKVIGQCCHCDFHRCVIVTSGRISCEMVLRAKFLGIPAIATLKYPTSSSLDFANRLGIQCIEIK